MEISRSLRILLVLLALPVYAPAADDIENPTSPYSVESVRAWHRELSETTNGWPWAYLPEDAVDLRGDGTKQLLICVGGGARSGEFVLFAQNHGQWLQISDVIDQSHHPIRRLRHSKAGWYDFQTFTPLWGSSGKVVLVVTYRWAYGRYREFSSLEGMWCDYKPFSEDEALCGGA